MSTEVKEAGFKEKFAKSQAYGNGGQSGFAPAPRPIATAPKPFDDGVRRPRHTVGDRY